MIIQQGINNKGSLDKDFVQAYNKVEEKDKTKKVSKSNQPKNRKDKVTKHKKDLHTSHDKVGIRLEIEKTLNMIITKIVNKENGEVLRQIPPDKRISISKAIRELEDKIKQRHQIDREV